MIYEHGKGWKNMTERFDLSAGKVPVMTRVYLPPCHVILPPELEKQIKSAADLIRLGIAFSIYQQIWRIICHSDADLP